MKNKKRNQPNRSFLEAMDDILGKNDWVIFWILFGVTLLVGILLYDPRVSPGGDDSAYVVSAHEFLKSFKFPGYQGPLYPIMLSLVDAIFGMSLAAFKAFSLVSILGFMLFTFLAFRKRIPPFLLFVTLLLTSVNSHVLYYASQTYSEAFYMFMLALLLFVFFRFFINREGQSLAFSEEIKRHLLLAITLIGIILTRSIGYVALLTLLGYFLIYRQWKNIGYTLGCFLLCFGTYQLIKYLLWGDASLQATGQGSSLLNKDFYKPEYGREDLAGFIQRFLINSNVYISNFFVSMLGLHESILPGGVHASPKTMLTILIYGLGITGIWMTFKQNRYLFFTGMLTGLSLIVTFVILQTIWNQQRLIIPAFPYIIMISFTAFYYLLKKERSRFIQSLIIVPVIILFFTSLSDTVKAIEAAQKLKNEYSGLTPDWKNYAQASAWAAKNLPEEDLVACRRAPISTIYGKGKEFYGIYRIKSSDIKYLIDKWSENEDQYFAITTEGMTEELYALVLEQYETRMLINLTYYLLIKNEGDIKQKVKKWPDLQIIESTEALKSLIKSTGDIAFVYDADSLLMPLKEKGVTHILTANLRLNPYVRDGRIVNTVERIVAFTQEKYPDLYILVQQFGTPNDEPAEILQIHWEVTNK